MQLAAALLLLPLTTMARLPNILILVVDDLGVGDVGVFGNSTLATPSFDSVCEAGARLSHHTAPATLCTPSRAGLLTGRYAVRAGLTSTPASAPVLIYAAGRAGLPAGVETVGSLAARAGYNTAMVGKWHLGLNARSWGDMQHGPLGHGFQYFYGLPHTLVDGWEKTEEHFFTLQQCFTGLELPILLACLIPARTVLGRKTFFSLVVLVSLVGWFLLEHFTLTRDKWWQHSDYMEAQLNSFLMENSTVVEKPVQLATLSAGLVNKSVQFIRRSVGSDKPFLLYHAFPHVHTPLVVGAGRTGRSGHGSYGDAVQEMDEGVGQLLAALHHIGATRDTLVYLTSDHGGDQPQLGQRGGWNGPHRGGKGNGALEGGIRVPACLAWPGGGVEAGTEVAAPTSLLVTMHNYIFSFIS